MAYALVAHTAAKSLNSTDVTTSAIDTTGATLLTVVTSWYGGSAALTDSKGNTWVGRTAYASATDTSCKGQIFDCASPTVGSGHTFTLTNLAPSVAVAAWSGSDATPFDQENGYTGSSSITPISPGSVTPSADNELLVTGTSGYSAAVSSINSGFTIADTIAYDGSNNNLTIGLAYKIQTSLGAENPAWTFAANQVGTAFTATYKAGGAAPTTRTNRLTLLGVA